MHRKFYQGIIGEENQDYTLEMYDKLKLNNIFYIDRPRQLGKFNEIKKGDVLLINFRKNLVAYGMVKEEPKITDDEYWNKQIELEKLYFHKGNGIGYYGITDNQIDGTKHDVIKELSPNWALQKIKEIDSATHLFKQLSKESFMQKYIDLLKHGKNLILTGAPGTGKTFLAKKIAAQILSETEMLSEVETDQETAIRKVIDNKLAKDAVYKTKSGTAEFVIIKIMNDTFVCQPKNGVHTYNVTKEDIVDCIISGKINEPVRNYDDLGGKGGTYIVGLSCFVLENLEKTYSQGQASFVQFHPSYDYTDFVEGLRPVQKGETLGFELKNGIFKEFCKKAKENPAGNYVFIIDEINRAEISKVFGELFFALDAGYRGEKGKVKTQYSNIQTEATAFTNVKNDYFYIPDNVYIIGTMNDIDRSVESFDFAMRRRFAWCEVKAVDRMDMWEDAPWKVSAASKMIALNQAIEKEAKLSAAYHVGPAYFLKLNQYQGDFEQLWQYHIETLLKEYLRGLPNETEILQKLKNVYDKPNENNG